MRNSAVVGETIAMSIEKLKNITSHHAVFEVSDPRAKLHGFIAVHSTALGPAAGGTRFWSYASREEALNDALRLSEGMSYKNAMAALPLGGGKAVIIKPQGAFDREALFEAYGRAIDTLAGLYITAEDVGVTPDDMVVIARKTRHVAGLPMDGEGAAPPRAAAPEKGFFAGIKSLFGRKAQETSAADTAGAGFPNYAAASGDPSPVTARGVFRGIQACADRKLGSSDLTGRRVAVQGVGHVGAYLCQHLFNAGALLTVTDVNQAALEEMVSRFGATVVAPDAIYDVEADIFAPCALGGVLNQDTVERLRVQIVAGGANNQLATPDMGEALVRRDILYAPDYVINGGGIINVAAEVSGRYDPEWVDTKLDALMDNLGRVLDIAIAGGVSTQSVADEFAQARLAAEPAA